MPELDTAGKYRRLADELADNGVRWAEHARERAGGAVGGPSADALERIAHAGKAALEAAALADVGETEIARIIRAMREELVAAGAIDDNELATLTVEEVLRLTAAVGKRGREIARKLNDTRAGYTILSNHVETLRAQALEAKGQGSDEEAIDRVVARHDHALLEARTYVDRGQA